MTPDSSSNCAFVHRWRSLVGSFISALKECGADRSGVEEGSAVMVNVPSQPKIQKKLRIEIRNVVSSDQ
jgi:hypothetical protein